MEQARERVDQGFADTVEQAFAALCEEHPEVFEMAKRIIPDAEAATDDGDTMADDAGGMDSDDDDDGPAAGPAGNQNDASAKGGRRKDGPDMGNGGGPARLVSGTTSFGAVEGSYNPSKRPPSASPPAAARGATTRVANPDFPDYGNPRSQRMRKLYIPGQDEREAQLASRVHRLLLKGYSAGDAMFIADAPTKAERTALKASFERSALDRVQKAALKEAMIAKGFTWVKPRRPKKQAVA
jgi:hypothetical protein